MTNHEGRHGHTQRDFHILTAAGFNPAATQPRERPITCFCGAVTMHQSGRCDRHYLYPGRLSPYKLMQRIHELEEVIEEVLAGLADEPALQWVMGHPWGHISQAEREAMDAHPSNGTV